MSRPEQFEAPENAGASPINPQSTPEPQGKPISWLSAGLINLLASVAASFAALFTGVLLGAITLVAGLLAHSLWVGVVIGIPMLIVLLIFYWYVDIKLTLSFLRSFGYREPGFWTASLAVLVGSIAAGIVIGILNTATLSMTGGLGDHNSISKAAGFHLSSTEIAVNILGMVVGLILQVGLIGFALQTISQSSVQERLAKIVSLIIAGLGLLLTLAIIAVSAAVVVAVIDNGKKTDSARNAEAISRIKEAETVLESTCKECLH